MWPSWLPWVLSSVGLSSDAFLQDVELGFHLLSVTTSFHAAWGRSLSVFVKWVKEQRRILSRPHVRKCCLLHVRKTGPLPAFWVFLYKITVADQKPMRNRCPAVTGVFVSFTESESSDEKETSVRWPCPEVPRCPTGLRWWVTITCEQSVRVLHQKD